MGCQARGAKGQGLKLRPFLAGWRPASPGAQRCPPLRKVPPGLVLLRALLAVLTCLGATGEASLFTASKPSQSFPEPSGTSRGLSEFNSCQGVRWHWEEGRRGPRRRPLGGRSLTGKLSTGSSGGTGSGSGSGTGSGSGQFRISAVSGAQSSRGKVDEWCAGQKDGLHADTQAREPCSGYFGCRTQTLVALHACPPGLAFSTGRKACVRPHQSSCTNASQGTGGGFDYRRYAALLPQTTALLEFKSRVLDFGNILQSWEVPRFSVTTTSSSNHTNSSNSDSSVSSSSSNTDISSHSSRSYRHRHRHRHILSHIRSQDGPNKLASATATATATAAATDVATAAATDAATATATATAAAAGGACKKPLHCCWKHVACIPGTGHVAELDVPTASLSSRPGQDSIPPLFSSLRRLSRLSMSGADPDSSEPSAGLAGGVPRALAALRELAHLDLSYNRLSGDLREVGVGRLRALRELRLGSNWLVGGIPPSLGGLRNLTLLDLSRNALEGPLPASLGRLTGLATLDVSHNRLTGPIPGAMGDAVLLQNCYMNRNLLEGSIPASLGKLRRLSGLDLSDNALSGTLPAAFSALSSLAALFVGGNRLSGNLPLGTLCGAGPLSNINLSGNAFRGPIDPLAFARCSALQTLDVSANRLSGPLPASMFLKDSGLATFDAHSNQLTGPLPSALFLLPSLVTLDLANNSFRGTLPRTLGPSVAYLNLSNNRLSGPLPLSLLNSSALGTLDVSSNNLRGSLHDLPRATLLTAQTLNLGGNGFSGPWPSGLGNMALSATLAQLDASSNRFSGPLPDLSQYTALTTIDLSSNRMGGPLEVTRLPRAQLANLNVSRNAFTGPIPPSISRLTALLDLNLSRNGLQGSLPASVSSLRSLTALDVSRNELEGVPPEIGELGSLWHLDLSANRIQGPIPNTTAPQTLQKLTFLDLSSNLFNGTIPYGFASATSAATTLSFANNSLCGPVPPGNLTATFGPATFEGNECLCGGPGLEGCPETPPGDAISTGAIVGIAVGCGLLLALCVGALWAWLFWGRRKSEWEGGAMLVFEKLDVPLSIDHVLESTREFDEEFLLGRGGFGSVYKGALPDGREVAIKRLAATSQQGQREFEAEVNALGALKHPNLVELVAAFVARPPSKERLLIYEYLPRGSLDTLLGVDLPEKSPFLTWAARKQIMQDTARGLRFLHHGCTPPVIHRDMKPGNVLLDADFRARLADFGLAREATAGQTHMSTAVCGTVGYLAPEYSNRGRLSLKSDVYAFGVVVLQIVTGRRPWDADVADRGLPRWVRMAPVLSVCDPRVRDARENVGEVLAAITLGERCTARVPSDRPSMDQVVHLLDHLDELVPPTPP